jgi:hypothetical protein
MKRVFQFPIVPRDIRIWLLRYLVVFVDCQRRCTLELCVYSTGIYFQTERMLDLSNKSLGLWAGLGTAALLGSYLIA